MSYGAATWWGKREDCVYFATETMDDNDSQGEVYDEADSASVFTVIDRSEIPDKFVVESGKAVRKKASHYLSILQSWGVALSPGSSHSLAMLTLDGGALSSKEAALKVVKKLTHKLPHQVEGLRWKNQQILLSFDSPEAYGNFANRFLEGKLDAGDDHQLISIEAAIFSSHTKVTINVNSNNSMDLHESLADSVVRFWATVDHLRIISDHTAPHPLPQSLIPHLGFIMVFGPHGLKNAQTIKDKLGHDPWKVIALDSQVASLLDPGTAFYQNALGGPLVGMKTGRPSSEVQLAVFVQRSENFDKMSSFYGDLLGCESALLRQGRDDARYRVYPLGLNQGSELMVAYLPGFTVATSPELELVVKVAELDKMADYGQPTDGSLIKDPEGNPIVPVQI